MKHALKREDIVFRGMIAGITESQVVFAVERVWKGNLPTQFAMPKILSTGPCIAGFIEAQLVVGSDILIYAHWVTASPKLPGFRPEQLPGYVVGVCTRTALTRDALVDLTKLGTGKQPRP